MEFSIDEIDRKMGRFMSETSAYSFVAAEEAIKDSGLDNDDIANNETGVIVGLELVQAEKLNVYLKLQKTA